MLFNVCPYQVSTSCLGLRPRFSIVSTGAQLIGVVIKVEYDPLHVGASFFTAEASLLRLGFYT